MNRISKSTIKTLTKEEKNISKLSSNYSFLGVQRMFKEYSIDNNGCIFADKLTNDKIDYYYNNADVLHSVIGIGKQLHRIFKLDLIKAPYNIIKPQTDVDELIFIDLKQEIKNLNKKEVLSNNFINKFITQELYISHLEEIKPLLLEFCYKNGMPFLNDDYSNTGALQINPIVFDFCQKNNIKLFGEDFSLDNRIIKFCQENNVSYLDTSKFFDTGKLYINTSVVNFCQKNNIPYLSFDGKRIDSRVQKFCEDNNLELITEKVNKFYYCDARPFVSLSIIIYILFESQDIVKHLMEYREQEPTLEKNSIGYIMNSKEDGNWYETIIEFLERLNNIIWFFGGTSKKDIRYYKSFSLYSFSECIAYYCNMIEKETSYIKYLSLPHFFYSDNKFAIEQVHNNLLSIAWSKLKLSMFSDYAKECKNPSCCSIFEPKTPKQEYCDDCLEFNVNKNINSNNSYNKKQNLHKQLVKIYNSANKSKLKSIDKNTLHNIEKYVSYNKVATIKKETTISVIEDYINILNNLK